MRTTSFPSAVALASFLSLATSCVSTARSAASDGQDRIHAQPSEQAAATETRGDETIVSFNYRGQFENGVEVVASAYLGPPVLLTSDFQGIAAGTTLRPLAHHVSFSWLDRVIYTSFGLSYEPVSERRGEAVSSSFQLQELFPDKTVPEPCMLGWELEPRVDTWGDVHSADDFKLALTESKWTPRPLSNPKPAVDAPK